jgi:hypothetical protein
MTYRALLVGAPMGLKGVLNDVEAMADALCRKGFTDVRRCAGPEATRDGILGAYRQLIADTGPEDVVLVYYSGHGDYVEPPTGQSLRAGANDRQFIVPSDWAPPTPEDFRGITAVELSVLLAELTLKTANAVVVLDCCYSGLMSRDLGDLTVRQLDEPVKYDLDAHLDRLRAGGLRTHLVDSTGNGNAVRIVACAPEQKAYERRLAGSKVHGVLTDAFVRALDETAGTRVSWARLMRRVRAQVQLTVPHQHPDVEGPFERYLFEEAVDDSAGSLAPVVEPDGRVRFDGASLLGVQPGDEFAIMPAAGDDPIATVRIDLSTPGWASGPLQPEDTVVPPDARAVRTRSVTPRVPVEVPQALVAAVGASTFVRLAGPGEIAAIRVVAGPGGTMTIQDGVGPLHEPRAPGSEAGIVQDLNRIARAMVVRGLREESGWTCDAPVTLEWGRVRHGTVQPLPAGAEITAGELAYLRIRNNGTDPVYLSLLDIGVSYAMTVLTDARSTGLRLRPGDWYTFGWDEPSGSITGRQLIWPAGLDQSSARPETVLALITSAPHDMTALEQASVRTRSAARSALSEVLAHLGGFTTREWTTTPPPAERFSVHSFEFLLVPPAAAVRQSPA